MRYKIYLRDWYFNAGIIGFLRVISNNTKNTEDFKSLKMLDIYDNYIEIDTSCLSDKFFNDYKKIIFCDLFDIDDYKERLDRLIKKISQPQTKITKKLLAEVGLAGKIINTFFKDFNNGADLNDLFESENFTAAVSKLRDDLNKYTDEDEIYTLLSSQKKGTFIDYFLDNEIVKKVCDIYKIREYVNKLDNNTSRNIKKEQLCFTCGEYKKEYDFSNAITQILGFNKDNSNWIWGFNSSKVSICPLCALIYACAPLGLIRTKRNIDGEIKNYFFGLNKNTDIATLYHSYWIFIDKMLKKENQNKPFYTILQEVAIELIVQKSKSAIDNINFIEIAENQFGGQSTKSYNVYNYQVTKNLAEFVNSYGYENIPKGYYKIKDTYYDVTEEIIKKTLEYTLSFSDLARYYDMYIRTFDSKSKMTVRFSIYKVTNYAMKYINYIKGGDKMSLEQITKKAFFNGKELSQKIGQDNKIKGIAYQFLNDLKIGDRNSFADRYLRLCISYGSESKLGSNNEFIDLDNFMTFGYSFVNGLLSNLKIEHEEANNG